jgi:hypothetical protein
LDSQSLLGLDFEVAAETRRAADVGSTTKPQPSGQAEASLPPISPAAQAALDGIQGAIDRLNRIGKAIRDASTSDLGLRVDRFTRKADNEHASFKRMALLVVKGLYPEITDSFVEQLATSISYRRQRLLYLKSHQEKLKGRRQPQPEPERHVESTLHDQMRQPTPKLARQERQTQGQASEIRSSAPSKGEASIVTYPSVLDSRSLKLVVNEQMEASTGPPTESSIAHNNPYPRPPKLPEGKGYCVCDWCYEELKVPHEKSRWMHIWRYVR